VNPAPGSLLFFHINQQEWFLIKSNIFNTSFEFNAENLDGATPVLAIDGWNINPSEKELK